MQPYNIDIIFYSSPEGKILVEVVYEGETFWLSQKRMAKLFGVEVPAISKHLKNIFESGELQEDKVKYEDGADFNLWWDEQFGEFEMGEYSYPASEILFSVDKQAYLNENKLFNESES